MEQTKRGLTFQAADNSWYTGIHLCPRQESQSLPISCWVTYNLCLEMKGMHTCAERQFSFFGLTANLVIAMQIMNASVLYRTCVEIWYIVCVFLM